MQDDRDALLKRLDRALEVNKRLATKGGAWCWVPVALRDRVTGRVFSLLVGLSNEDAARRWQAARERV